jgi:hypothetical protein
MLVGKIRAKELAGRFKMKIKTEKFYGLTISIEADEDCQDPCDMFDDLGTMVCCHSRYNLGHKQDTNEAIEELANDPQNIVLPLYLYDHSGITMNTTGFSCPWDSGQVGIIYVSKEKIRSEYGVKRISPKLRAKVLKVLKGEVETYDDYLTGNVWGYTVADASGDIIDSCWGFYGDYEKNCLVEARLSAKSIVKSKVQDHIANLKRWIKGKVELQYRTSCPFNGGSF